MNREITVRAGLAQHALTILGRLAFGTGVRTSRSLIFALMWFGCGGATLLAQPQPASVGSTDQALVTLLKADRTTPGTEEFRQAWQSVAQWPADRLVEVLDAADDANPVALNWLRTAIDSMIERPGFKTPIAELQQVVQDTERKFAARRIAWELLESADPNLIEALKEDFLDDPIPAFRRPAIEKRIAAANQLPKNSDERKKLYQDIFQYARDEDQVGILAGVLTDDFGEKPDLAKHFGFVLNWHVVGPFSNIDEAGFHEAYSPEKVSLSDFDRDGKPNESLEYEGVDGKLRWQKKAAVNDTGELDLNQCLGKEKEVVGYGVAVFNSATERPAEIRLRMQNAFKLWLNGELLMSQPIGHTGNSFDQYVIPVTLKRGQNLILIKSCQNKPPQEMEWFDTWHFNVRICDASGAAIEEGE